MTKWKKNTIPWINKKFCHARVAHKLERLQLQIILIDFPILRLLSYPVRLRFAGSAHILERRYPLIRHDIDRVYQNDRVHAGNELQNNSKFIYQIYQIYIWVNCNFLVRLVRKTESRPKQFLGSAFYYTLCLCYTAKISQHLTTY